MRIYITVILLLIFSVNIQAQQQRQTSINFFNSIKSEADPAKKEHLLLEWEKQSSSETGVMPGMDLVDFSRQLIAQAFAEEANGTKAKYWIERIKDPAGKIAVKLSLVRELTSKNQLAEAEKILLPLYEQLKLAAVPEAQTNKVSMAQMPTVADCEHVYADILYKKGDYQKALQFIKPTEASVGRRGTNELYALALAKAGETEKAIAVMSKMIFAPGHRSDDFKTTAQKLFAEKYGDDKRFHWLLDSAATIEQKKIEAKVALMKADEPAPDFNVTDLNGKTVSLSSLRGKTVILDFWATWCQPCVASFPGMQKAVDYYKNDPSVVFMFIHTMEKNGSATEEAREFMKYKKYRFDVYMDLRDKITKKSPVVTSYKVNGIPAKFVINKNGRIVFKNSGYISEDEAVPEIKTMIEMSRI